MSKISKFIAIICLGVGFHALGASSTCTPDHRHVGYNSIGRALANGFCEGGLLHITSEDDYRSVEKITKWETKVIERGLFGNPIRKELCIFSLPLDSDPSSPTFLRPMNGFEAFHSLVSQQGEAVCFRRNANVIDKIVRILQNQGVLLIEFYGSDNDQNPIYKNISAANLSEKHLEEIPVN